MQVYADKSTENKKQFVSLALPAQAAGERPAYYLQDNRPRSVIQKKQVDALADKQASKITFQGKANNTGLPDTLKSGIENLSGYSMNDVKVHYNSSKPAQLNAHAYAQGTEIHLATGQEKHLPHEAWHVVQQKQGRVMPTFQLKGKINVNDDKGLEKEADVMGRKAMAVQLRSSVPEIKETFLLNRKIVQRQLLPDDLTKFHDWLKGFNNIDIPKDRIAEIAKETEDLFDAKQRILDNIAIIATKKRLKIIKETLDKYKPPINDDSAGGSSAELNNKPPVVLNDRAKKAAENRLKVKQAEASRKIKSGSASSSSSSSSPATSKTQGELEIMEGEKEELEHGGLGKVLPVLLQSLAGLLIKKYPPDTNTYIMMGNSPAPLLAWMHVNRPDVAAVHLALGKLSSPKGEKIVKAPDEKDTLQTALFSHFDKQLVRAVALKRSLVLVDYVSSGDSVIVASEYIKAWLLKHHPQLNLAIRYFGYSENSDKALKVLQKLKGGGHEGVLAMPKSKQANVFISMNAKKLYKDALLLKGPSSMDMEKFSQEDGLKDAVEDHPEYWARLLNLMEKDKKSKESGLANER